MNNQITADQLYELFIDTIQKANTIELKSDEEIEYDILEEFNSGIQSFLHDSSLETLIKYGKIDESIKLLAKRIRESALSIPWENWNIEKIRNDPKWNSVFEYVNSIIKQIEAYNAHD